MAFWSLFDIIWGALLEPLGIAFSRPAASTSVATVSELFGQPLSGFLFFKRASRSHAETGFFRVFVGVFLFLRFLEGFGWSPDVLLEVAGCQKEPKVSKQVLERRVFAELVETRFDW